LAALALAALALAALAFTGCGSNGGGPSVTVPGAREASTAGVPRALARNISEANIIVDGKGNLLKQKLAALHGYPIVINQWASWCGPCRYEFPFFQVEARKYRTGVAFLGLDMRDTKKAAASFLRDIPSSFPSIFDPQARYTSSLGGGRISPSTFFIGPGGEEVHTSPGAYAHLRDLDADIRRYASRGRGG